ncbi:MULTISPECIES: VOC family protein [unclassified Spirosoma]|uniref:VOC family protein n=1 Tax=unclassified Spirosoma TaxID=2621999 RepID=UPI001AC86F0D|nr:MULTISPECIES: VOC family protein [unclassified Spirosoma]MBN8824311.1 VOC family protein [Spirosoma sp.]
MDFITFGAVHLNVTDISRSINFWRDVVGMQVRSTGETTEIGTAQRTLVVLHPGSKTPYRKGFSGLYHAAIHLPTETDLAQLLVRLATKGWDVAPTDHIIAKSLYVDDPDGINLEFAVETPQRVVEFNATENGVQIVDNQGRFRKPIEPLDVQELLSHLTDKNPERAFPDGAIVGHMNLHVPHLQTAYDFYTRIGFSRHVLIPRQGWGDLGAGGAVDHRIAVNVWAGMNAPKAPEGTAGLRYFTLKYDSQERLSKALSNSTNSQKTPDGYFLEDPAGNKFLIA